MTMYNVRRYGLKISRYDRNGMWFEVGHKRNSIYMDAYGDYEDDGKKIFWARIYTKNLYTLKVNGYFAETDYPYMLYFKLKHGTTPNDKDLQTYYKKYGSFSNQQSANIEKKNCGIT